MIISFDIDGILCHETQGHPLHGAKEKIYKLIGEGHSIIYWTARPEIDRMITTNWLEQHGFPNVPLFMGKPQAHIYVDDRAVSSIDELNTKLCMI